MGAQRHKLFLVKSDSSMADGQALKTGAMVPSTGIYKVIHEAHRLPHEVMLLGGERFPRCAKCGDSVAFELVRRVLDTFVEPVRLYELPVIGDEDQTAAAS
jgi:hypothetical protein